MALPGLTWNMTGWTAVASPGSASSVLAAIDTLFDGMTYWEVKNDDQANGAIVVGPKSASAISTARAIIACHTSTNITEANCCNKHQSASSNNKRVFVGYCVDGSTGTYTDGVWDSAAPFGAGKQWSKYARAGDDCEANPIDQVYAVESDEICAVFMHDSAANEWHAFVIGAILEQPGDTRVQGVTALGNNAVVNTFWNSGSSFLDSGASSISNSVFMVMSPADTTQWLECSKVFTKSLLSPWFTTSNGHRIHLPVPYYFSAQAHGGASPVANLAGTLRQMNYGQDCASRTTISSGGSVKAYAFSPSATSADALTFDNA